MAQEKMDLDLEPLPSSTTIEDNTLRRSSSAPLINELRNDSQVFQPDTLRARRNSTTFVGQPCLEEGMDLGNRETIHEWEVQTAIQITQSWKESLNVGNNNLEKAPSPECSNLTPASSATFLTGRTGKQCFSPSLQACVSCTGFLPSPIPSPVRRFAISQSPINILRSSILGPLKRKGEMVLEHQPKRFFQDTTNVVSSGTTHMSDSNTWTSAFGKSMGQLFCRMSLSLGLPHAFS
ncbi:protein FAM122C isoform X1 [Camelus ferus]|uniref:Protein FAM122C isoform X1 n=1 Tax=Camelus ferus TaxID=419612 RepID=A0A8B8SJW9_CAMFR|nr:protein FAM122C isoform X1 [Camelus ferus]XP_032330529.1 protein FAM122C isoform X1 [Camelus ferus]